MELRRVPRDLLLQRGLMPRFLKPRKEPTSTRIYGVYVRWAQSLRNGDQPWAFLRHRSAERALVAGHSALLLAAALNFTIRLTDPVEITGSVLDNEAELDFEEIVGAEVLALNLTSEWEPSKVEKKFTARVLEFRHNHDKPTAILSTIPLIHPVDSFENYFGPRLAKIVKSRCGDLKC